MADAVTNYYSKPSGQQGGSSRKMGAGTGRFTIPLWKTKEKVTANQTAHLHQMV